jgi:RNA polymerase sigma-70 factor (ECF subfamily)
MVLPQQVEDSSAALLRLYDQALPEVYGYLMSRCRDRALAEGLTAETFLAAVGATGEVSVRWLIGTARHKLAGHRRWKAHQERLREAAGSLAAVEDPDREIDVLLAHEVLDQLGPHHRAALTLRYLDGLSVPETAAVLERTVHATEALLTRARTAFRRTC